MTIDAMRAALRRATDRHVAELDRRDALALSDLAAAWAAYAATVGRKGWSPDTWKAGAGLVARRSIEAAKGLQALAVGHAADELATLSQEAAAVARSAHVDPVNAVPIETLAMGMLERIRPEVEASADHEGSLLAEASQADRILQTESFRAYNAARSTVNATLLAHGDGATYSVHAPPGRRFDPGKWVPAILTVWNATLDKRTCPKCAALDGRILPLGAYFDGPDPPRHARCRCVISYWPVAFPRS